MMRAVTVPGPADGRLPVLIGLAAWVFTCLLPLDGDGVGWVAVRFVQLAVVFVGRSLTALARTRPAQRPVARPAGGDTA